jgi:predicted  nucleic acid-binding Zn-ribbon protein
MNTNLKIAQRLKTRFTPRSWLLILILVAAVASLGNAAAPQKSPCDGLIAAIGRAQGDYNRARSARIKAEGDLNRAKGNVKVIAAKIKANEAQQSSAEGVLDRLKEERARCDNANGDLAPLSGNCASVQARIDRANKDIAALRAEHGRLEDQRTAAEMDVERNEREFAVQRAAEATALAALDQAKKNAASCRRAA